VEQGNNPDTAIAPAIPRKCQKECIVVVSLQSSNTPPNDRYRGTQPAVSPPATDMFPTSQSPPTFPLLQPSLSRRFDEPTLMLVARAW